MEVEGQSDDEYVICPYCEAKSGDCWEWVTGQEQTMKCDECGKEFRYWAEYDVTYNTESIEET